MGAQATSVLLTVVVLGAHWVCRVASRSPDVRVVVEASVRNLSLLRNWIAHSHAVRADLLDYLVVLCSDAGLSDELVRLDPGLRCHQPAPAGEEIFQRIDAIRSILSNGHDVLVSDLDALWLRDPFPLLDRHLSERETHILSSRDYFPRPLAAEWGSTLSMGFAYFRAHNSTLRLLGLVRQHMAVAQSAYLSHAQRGNHSGVDAVSDQLSLNEVLHAHGPHWPRAMSLDNSTDSAHASIPFGQSVLHVASLPEGAVARNCLGESASLVGAERFPTPILQRIASRRTADAAVAHCMLTCGDAARHQNMLILYQLWRPPHDAHAAYRELWVAFHSKIVVRHTARQPPIAKRRPRAKPQQPRP